jgi:hypothetical protein
MLEVDRGLGLDWMLELNHGLQRVRQVVQG